MKYSLFFIFTACFSISYCQSFSAYKINSSATTTLATLSNGSTLFETTTASTNTTSPSLTIVRVNLVNNSATTLTLNVIRQVTFNSPALLLNGSNGVPDTYFTFGTTVFPSNISTAGPSDYVILGAAGSTSPPYANSSANGNPFFIFLAEDMTLGTYAVKYKLFDVNNPNDTLSFTIQYNATLGLNNPQDILSSEVKLFPNPGENFVFISWKDTNEEFLKIEISDFTGRVIEEKSLKNTPFQPLPNVFDFSNYPSGIYNCSFISNKSKITKRMVINK